MAAAQTSGKRSAVEVTTEGKSVRIIEDGKVRTLRSGSRRDPGLFNADIDYLLRCSSSQLGQRGTMAAVVSAIERGGATGGGEDPNLAMLRRVGFAEDTGQRPRDNVIGRERQLSARWVTLPSHHQRTAVALYLLTTRVDSKIGARCGAMSGVVVLRWLDSAAERRQEIRGQLGAKVRQELAGKVAALELEETAHSMARAGTKDRKRRFQRTARYRLEWVATGRLAALRSLRSEVGALLNRESACAAVGSAEADLAALAKECERGEVLGLVAGAEEAVRAMHAAWEQTGRRAADAWVEA